MHPVENGIPQGSPVSPILAAFYSAELLEIFAPPPQASTFPHPDQVTETNLLMYVDDGKLYTSSKFLDTNITTLKAAYIKTEAWLQSPGLSSDVSKREIMHYSRRRGDNSSPSITLQDNDSITRTVTPTATVRWLGVYFDRKLRFEHHAKSLAARGENTVSSFTMLANTIRGLSHAHLRQLYIACVTNPLRMPSVVDRQTVPNLPARKSPTLSPPPHLCRFQNYTNTHSRNRSLHPFHPYPSSVPCSKVCHPLQQTPHVKPNHPTPPKPMEEQPNPLPPPSPSLPTAIQLHTEPQEIHHLTGPISLHKPQPRTHQPIPYPTLVPISTIFSLSFHSKPSPPQYCKTRCY